MLAELTFWRWRPGDLREVPETAVGPFALAVRDRWSVSAVARERCARRFAHSTILAPAAAVESATRHAGVGRIGLTRREQEILDLLVEGLRNAEMAGGVAAAVAVASI